ncbi:MAG: hypothetical protein IJS15_14580 [Victivallales bacterium]|nr:hypothetical protein [Victivallales bacterium]
MTNKDLKKAQDILRAIVGAGNAALRESKALEKRVDAMLDDLQARQLTLGFEGEATK